MNVIRLRRFTVWPLLIFTLALLWQSGVNLFIAFDSSIYKLSSCNLAKGEPAVFMSIKTGQTWQLNDATHFGKLCDLCLTANDVIATSLPLLTTSLSKQSFKPPFHTRIFTAHFNTPLARGPPAVG